MTVSDLSCLLTLIVHISYPDAFLQNCALAVVGKDREFSIYKPEDIEPLLTRTSDTQSEESEVVTTPMQPCGPVPMDEE